MRIKFAIVLFCVSGFTGLTLPRCKSAPTPRETVEAITDVDELEQFLQESDAPAVVKAQGKKLADNVRDVLTRQGDGLAQCLADVENLKIYRALVYGFAAACVVFGALAAFLFFRR